MPGETQACFTGPESARGVGACKAGTMTCQTSGEFYIWGPCEGEQLPGEESCEPPGADEDCDGATDETCACEPTVETCDGLDNDCDGAVDEDLVQPCGAGSCEMQTCEAGQWSACGSGQVVFEDSFEGVVAPVVGITPPSLVSAWTVEAGDVDTMIDPAGFFGPAHTGAKAIDLNGWTSGKISTSLPTELGASYLLTFAYTKNPGKTDPGPATANVAVEGVQALQLSAAPPNTYQDLMWECGVVSITAAGPTTQVVFESTNPGNGGIYLDTFVLTKQ